METILIKYHVDIKHINKYEFGDWIDLRSAEDIELFPLQFKLIPLGVSMQLPFGYEAHISPRSSTYKNFGIIQTNSVGVVDESYCGDDDQWYFPAFSVHGSTIQKNDRICQFRIIKKQPRINFIVVNELNNKNRGGIGSTGIK